MGDSKVDLLELKVAAWAVVTPGWESVLQCIRSRCIYCDPFPFPTIPKCSKTAFLLGVKWSVKRLCEAPVGRGAAVTGTGTRAQPWGNWQGGQHPSEPAQAPRQGHRTSPKPPDTNHDKRCSIMQKLVVCFSPAVRESKQW
jgi:hypothetical protein